MEKAEKLTVKKLKKGGIKIVFNDERQITLPYEPDFDRLSPLTVATNMLDAMGHYVVSYSIKEEIVDIHYV